MQIDVPQTTSGGRRTDKVYRALLTEIKEGRYETHSKLPTENELAETFAVSRPVVRNALALLKKQGLVRSVQGSGSVVIFRLGPRNLEHDSGGGSVRDLQRCFEFRILIEGEAAYAAALRHVPRTLEQMADCIYNNRDPVLPPPAEQVYQTFDFHRAVVDAADNIFLQHSLDFIVASTGFRAYLSRRRGRDGSINDYGQVNSEHIEIFRLIERRQAEHAREAMRGHIQRAHDNFMGHIPLTDSE